MNVTIRRAHNFPPAELKMRADKLLAGLSKRFPKDFTFTWLASATEANFKVTGGLARGIAGKVELRTDEVVVTAELPAILVAMKGMLVSVTEEELKEALK